MNENPLIKFVILFILGIIIGAVSNIPFVMLAILAGSFLILLTLNQILKIQIPGWFKSTAVYLLIITFGISHFLFANRNKITYPFKEASYSNAVIYGEISWLELKREGRMIMYINMDSVATDKGSFMGKKKILCSLYDNSSRIDSLYQIVSVGNKIELTGTLRNARDKRNPYEFDYSKYLQGKDISALFTSYDAGSLKVRSGDISVYKNTVFRIREILDSKIQILQNKTTAALLRGLLLADRSRIDYEVQNDFVNAGVVHVLSVSGLHVGYIVLIFLIVFKRFNIYIRYALTVIGLIFYMILTGADSPVVRSTIMAIILLSGPILQRNYNSLNALALAAFIILAFNPNQLFNPGFQLSFTAMLSLILLYPMLSREIGKLRINSKVVRYILLFCASTLAAQLGTLPFTLTYFHRLSISSFAANMIVIPLSGFVVGLGILSLLVGSFLLGIGQIFGAANNLLTYILYETIRILGQGEFSYLSIRQFSIYDALIFYLALTLLIIILKKYSNLLFKILFALFTFAAAFVFMRLDNFSMMPENVLSVMAVDVGQGNAVLIKFPNGKTALIDAGNATPYFDNGKRVIIPLLSQFGIDRINYGFVSHIDSDHSAGFLSLLKEHRIENIIKPGADSSSAIDVSFENLCKKESVPIHYFCKEKFAIGNARLYVLNDSIKKYFKSLTSNDKSGIIKLVCGNKSFLFTGDASTKIEKDYTKRYGKFLNADVLVAGHHGSRSSSSENFIDQVRPSMTVISVGMFNRFNHPHKETLDKYKSRNIEILRTDYTGAVLLQSDGCSIKQINWRNYENGILL